MDENITGEDNGHIAMGGVWLRDVVTIVDTGHVEAEEGGEILGMIKGSITELETGDIVSEEPLFKFWKGNSIFIQTSLSNFESFLLSFCEEILKMN